MEEYLIITEESILKTKSHSLSEAVDQFKKKSPIGLNINVIGVIQAKHGKLALDLFFNKSKKSNH